jgi:hypothetical protein
MAVWCILKSDTVMMPALLFLLRLLWLFSHRDRLEGQELNIVKSLLMAKISLYLLVLIFLLNKVRFWGSEQSDSLIDSC